MPYFVYLMANQKNGTLYVGVTNDLVRRVYEHKQNLADGFTKRYNVEMHATMEYAIQREKALKSWKRAWKLELVETANPDWRDLYPEVVS